MKFLKGNFGLAVFVMALLALGLGLDLTAVRGQDWLPATVTEIDQVQEAGFLSGAKDWFGGEVAAMILSALFALLAAFLGIFYTRAVRTLKEAGDFLTVLAQAMEDKRIDRDELAKIIKEGKDIFIAWKT